MELIELVIGTLIAVGFFGFLAVSIIGTIVSYIVVIIAAVIRHDRIDHEV